MDSTADLMTRNPHVVAPSTQLATCARQMMRHRVRHLPVISDEGRALGMLTDVACFRRGCLVGLEHEMWIPFQLEDLGMIAAEANSPVEVVAKEDDPVVRTMRRMTASSQDFAVVVDNDNRLSGILTENDGLRIAAAILTDRCRTVGAESSAPVHVTRGSGPAIEAMNRMDKHGFRHMAVVDDGRLVGVISRGDMIADNVGRRESLLVEDVMGEGAVHTVAPGESLAAAAGLMLAQGVGCLPVLGPGGNVIQILTRTDVIEAAVVALDASAVSQPLEESVTGSV